MLGTELSVQLSRTIHAPAYTPATFSVSKPNKPSDCLGDTWMGLNFGLALELYKEG